MTFMATCRAAVYGATIDNGLGDAIDDNDTPVEGLEDVRASLIEKSRKLFDATTGASRTVRWCVARFDAHLAPLFAEGYRIKDLRSGKIYVIDELTVDVHGLASNADFVLDTRIL